MDASLDTNMIIHLYQSNTQNILFELFDRIYVHSFIIDVELHRHASKTVTDTFMTDVYSGKIEIINEECLKNSGVLPLFNGYFNETRPLYNASDLGEVYAIALAETFGIACLLTNDTKIGGPHATLIRLPASSTVPLTFYEILFILFLKNKISFDALTESFNNIISVNSLSYTMLGCYKNFVQRFIYKKYTKRENEWLEENLCNPKYISDLKALFEMIKNYDKQ